MEQYKEVNITKAKGTSENKIKKLFNSIYSFVYKQLKNEKEFKNSLLVEKAKFVRYVNGDKSIGIIVLYSDLLQKEYPAFVINPSVEFQSGDVILAGYFNSLSNLYILGRGDKYVKN